jgi:hypothetical protein
LIVAELPSLEVSGRPAVIAAFGSCRLYEPFLSVFPEFGFNMVYGQFSPFTYSAGEAWQYIEFCRGSVDFPEWQWPYIFSDIRTTKPPAALQDAVNRADVFLIEISTLDQLNCDGRFFNWNELGLRFVRGQDESHFGWWREVSDRTTRRASPETIERVVEADTKLGKEPPSEFHAFLSGMRFETLEAPLLEQYIKKITFMSGKKWIFVSHLNIALHGPQMLPDRKIVLDTLRNVAGGLGHTIFDPTPTLVEYGYKRGLQGDGADTHHYNPEFRPVLGRVFLDCIRSTLSGDTKASS